MDRERRAGVLAAASAYALWGVLPVYWKLLGGVPALELIAHRVVWCALLLAAALVLAGRGHELAAVWRDRRTVALHAIAAALIASNWLIYVWAVNAGRIVETSLGYFINPLLSVALGVLVLKERLRPAQRAALALAAAGVAWLTWSHGRLPWIALALATAFGLYGLVKKTAPTRALPALALETALLAPFALAGLLALGLSGGGALGRGGPGRDLLLAGTGLVTAVPLGLFGAGARRIPLIWTGLLQYLAPTLQFAIGVCIFREPFGPDRLIGFVLVWLALAVFAVDGWRAATGRGGRRLWGRPADGS
jgi:chloramphenicol-sensitive protein RarD